MMPRLSIFMLLLLTDFCSGAVEKSSRVAVEVSPIGNLRGRPGLDWMSGLDDSSDFIHTLRRWSWLHPSALQFSSLQLLMRHVRSEQNPSAVTAAGSNPVVQAVDEEVAEKIPPSSMPAGYGASAMHASPGTGSNGSSPDSPGESEEEGYVHWAYHHPMYMMLYLVVLLLLSTVALDKLYKEKKDGDKDARTTIGEKPFSWAARFPGLVLMLMFAVYSLPFTGYILSGCFWNSLGGLSITATLASACLPQWLELCGLPKSPVPVPKIGLKNSAIALLSAAPGGIVLSMFYGSDECAPLFYRSSMLLVPVAVLMGWAWWQGEGGGLMGAARMVM